MWVIFGHLAVLPKKSVQRVSGLELGTLSLYTQLLATRPLPPLVSVKTFHADIDLNFPALTVRILHIILSTFTSES